MHSSSGNSHGADVNASNEYNETLLIVTISSWEREQRYHNILLNTAVDPEVFQPISHGADVKATNKSSKTALIVACEKEIKIALMLFLYPGVNPTTYDDDTCLHYSVQGMCNEDTLQIFINPDTDMNARNTQSKCSSLSVHERR